jgi:hypothetical protein
LTNIWIAILTSGIFSGLVAAGVTNFIQLRAAAKQRKLDCLRRLAASRSMPPTDKFVEALNEICITFNDSPLVMKALANFERDIRATGGHKNELLTDLFKTMMDALKPSRKDLDNEFLLRPFAVKKP